MEPVPSPQPQTASATQATGVFPLFNHGLMGFLLLLYRASVNAKCQKDCQIPQISRDVQERPKEPEHPKEQGSNE